MRATLVGEETGLQGLLEEGVEPCGAPCLFTGWKGGGGVEKGLSGLEKVWLIGLEEVWLGGKCEMRMRVIRWTGKE